MSIHRGPNTKKGGLVFGYDTGYGAADNSTPTRHYHGEPTTNLASTDSLRTMVKYADNSVASSDAPEKGPGWKKVTITNRGTNFRTAKFPYISHPTNTTRIYSLEIDFNGTSGYYIRGDGFSGLGPNQYTNGQYIATFTTTTNNGVMALFLNNGATSVTGINDVIYYRNYQVETNNYKTPFTTGTRSSTESLIDLKRTTDIDVSSMSFDSTGQPTFDGTDDDIDLGSDVTFKTSGGWTVESVARYNSVAGGYNNVTSPANFIGSDSISYNSWYWSVLSGKLALWNISPGVWKYGSTTLQQDTWYHVTIVCSDDGTSYQMYLNGVAEGGDHTTYSWNPSYSGLKIKYIGRGNNSNVRLVNGDIAITKVYGMALTPEEIKQNFNTYKNRFNI
jgi:hypothetical protein